MKEQQTVKVIFNETKKDKENLPQQQTSKEKRLSLQSQKDDDALESSIAQQEVIMSQMKNNVKQRKNSIPNIDEKHEAMDSFFDKFQGRHQKQNSFFLLAESLNNKVSIVTIKQVKAYEQKARSKNLPFRFSIKSQQQFLRVQNTNHLKQDKHLKKSLSSSKINRQKQGVIDSKHTVKKSQHSQNMVDQRVYRKSQDFGSVNESYQKQHKSRQSIHKNAPSIPPHSIPFSYQNITTTINNLQHQNDLQLQIDSVGSVRSQSYGNMKDYHRNGNMHHRKSMKNKKANQLMKQLNSSKCMIDVPLDLNEFQYQLKMQVALQKNRGFQLYLTSPQSSFTPGQQGCFEDVQHFKYEIVRLPYNLIRVRVYLLIETQSNNKNSQTITQPRESFQQTVKKDFMENKKQDQQQYQLKFSSIICKKQWKVWKQMQLPLVYNEKDAENNHQHFSSNKKIKISLTYVNLNTVRVEINNMLDFHLTLNHPKVPVAYFCLHQDFNGVEFNKISLSGSEGLKTQQVMLGDGCQGKCQLI